MDVGVAVATSSATLTVDGATVSGNTASSSGGGIHSADGLVTIQGGAQISGNDAGDTGSGVYVSGISADLTR
ncbi:MAG: hypothetical protein IPK19_20725 [Chloroflexi bacterium]|nr:hypothetical protein [Chloroflexota bacterium]